MRRILLSASALALLGFLQVAQGQEEKKLLPTNGWGSLSGKVTLDGKVPDVESFEKRMNEHADKACCLAKDAKPKEKVDRTWVVDPQTKAVANVVVWIKAPKGAYFPLPPNYKPSNATIVIDQPHCAFLPRVSAYNPVTIIDGKEVQTGQQVQFKNSATVPHNTRATGLPDKEKNSFNINIPPGAAILKSFEPQRLPISVQCDVHTWMAAKLFVFDHPYYAITKEDGTFEIPQVPAGSEVSLLAQHEGVGWVFVPEYAKGKAITLKASKNMYDFQVKAPQ